VTTANDLGRGVDSPPLVKIESRGMQLDFSKDSDIARFRYGFRVDEAQSYLFGAQVEFLLAKLALEKKDRAQAEAHLTQAERNTGVARQLLTFIKALGDPAWSGKLLISGGQAGDGERLQQWTTRQVAKALALQAGMDEFKQSL